MTTGVAVVAADDGVAPPIAKPTPDIPATTTNMALTVQAARLQREKRVERLDWYTVGPFEGRVISADDLPGS